MSGVVLHCAPHPDDELIGAPATLMALRDADWRVVNLACSLGRPEQRSRREAELREACRLAGFELRVPARTAAISSDDDPIAARAELRDLVREAVADLGPQLVISPAPHDRHHGHELAARAVGDVLNEQREPAPRWWMWGLWASLPLPTLATAFDQKRLDEILHALSAYTGELRRNDYRQLVKNRAAMNVSLGPELLFGFGEAAPAVPYVELLTEVVPSDGGWLLGKARWLDPASPLMSPSEVVADEWILEPSVTDRFGPPGVQGALDGV